ncbi:hypothetical protein PHYBOEH_010468 [Phytophthora boehmeriae]|uniref:RxLR effector protein n=1 Tax=Phytophthora boehmeriae TaxID=109152 RepID=A0A8T1VR69_9STRA|nr:hypothetical protein PHYBOEH_010468 [Phytophthora boehmeriae]
MRTLSTLALIATALYVSSSAGLETTGSKQMKLASSDTLVSNHPLSADEVGIIAKRSLRAHGAGEDGDTEDEEEEEEDSEERVTIPKASALLKKLDLNDLTEANIVRGVLKDHAPDKILTKIGVSPSFVTADGQKVYSKYDPGYQQYRQWDKWVQENLDWIVKLLK